MRLPSGDQATEGGEHLVHDGGDIWSMHYIGVDDQEHASSYDIVGSANYSHIDWQFAKLLAISDSHHGW